MKAYTVLAVLAASLASAQLADIPQCALTCAISSIGSSGCSSQTDIKCICQASAFITALTPCVEKACSADDLAKTIKAAEGLCASVGVSLSIPAPGGASTTAASSAAATSAPVTTMVTTTSAVVVVPSVVPNTTTTVVAPTNGTMSSSPTLSVPSPSASNAAGRNAVALTGLGAVAALAAALL